MQTTTPSADSLTPFELRFAYAERPKDVLPGDLDQRRLSMACRHLALVPRGAARRPLPSVEPSGHLDMPFGSTVGWAVPAEHRVTVQFGDVDSDYQDCIVRLTLSQGASRQTLWQGSVQQLSGWTQSFDTEAPARFELSFGDPYELSNQDADAPPQRLRFQTHQLLQWTPRRSTTASTADSPPPRTPHLFIYLIDTLRADTLAPYGGDPETTPAIAAFAEDAVVYQAWSTSAWTLPSVVSLFSGAYPSRHGVLRGDTRYDGDGFPSLAHRLTQAGYDTVAISQSLVASHRFGLDHGFDRFYLNNQLNSLSQRSQELRSFLLFDLLHRPAPQRPIFAYLHGVAPHAPYVPARTDRRWADSRPGRLPAQDYQPHIFMERRLTEETEVAHIQGLYQGEVAYADRQFGHFLDLLRHLELYEDSLIVLLSDHGEEFAEHGGFDHGRTPYEEMLRVPLIVKYPRQVAAGTSIEERVSIVDVAPTLLDAAGVTPPDGLDGRVLPRQTPERRSRRAIVANVHPAPARKLKAVAYDVLALGQLKCVQSHNGINQFGQPIPNWQTFDLTQDADELSPLPEDSEDVATCQRLLGQWREAQAALGDSASPQVTDDATLEKLRSLGYID